MTTLTDPLEYYSLLQLVDAPGIVPGQGPSCQYVRTPTTSVNASTPTWTCPAGHFCVSPKHTAPCTPGFYCPPNTAQPMYCCEGYYCSNDTTTLTLCPQNQYCPRGSVGGGTSCLWLASCPAGSASASKFGLALFVILLIIGICIVFWIHRRIEKVRTLHLEKRLRWVHNHHHNDNFLIADEADLANEQDDQEETAEGSSTNENGDRVIQIDASGSTGGSAQRPTLKRRITKVTQTFDIEFEHLGLTLTNGTTILQNVSGVLRTGRACAIMGPSGSGKTTLISMLTSKVPKDEGRIFINGQEEDLSHYRKLIGYVPQDDVMLRELTVHDILLHSAYMRLPAKLTRPQMTEKVLEIVDFLGLNSVMNSVVGDTVRRGISGGQRKRVNIGMELVTDPSILFLDEPTSGLDSSTSVDVCRLLRSIAHNKGLTVAAVIHSPSPVAFEQFDDLILLGHGGHVVYHGSRTEAPSYFAAIGFPVPKDASPSDFYMDVISNNVKSKIAKKFRPFYLYRYWESYCKRAQTFYADGTSSVDYRHPSTQATNGSFIAPAYARVNQSTISIQNNSHLPESFAMSTMNETTPMTSTAMSNPESNSASSSTLHPSSALNGDNEKRRSHYSHRSVSKLRNSVAIDSKSATSSPRASMDFQSLYDSPPPPEKLTWMETIQRTIRIFFIDARMWWGGIFEETKETLSGLFFKGRDPIRNTASPLMMFWLCLSRARLQIYRNQRQFLYDQLLHLGCGMFISVAASKFDYYGSQPDLICAMTPYQLLPSCLYPTDHLTEVGVFVALGVCFAGISVGSMTFGNEKIVYWREKSSGLLTLPYYLAKVIADIPRIVLAGVMFSISLIIFFDERSNYFYLLFIIIMLYAVAFAMGYLLSALIPPARVALVGTGFTLAWAIVFSGDAPDLADVMNSTSGGYRATYWIWAISAPRYAIEAIYLREIQARPWVEIRTQPLAHTYKLDQFWWCFSAMTYILLGWHFLAFMSFKLKDRAKQR